MVQNSLKVFTVMGNRKLQYNNHLFLYFETEILLKSEPTIMIYFYLELTYLFFLSLILSILMGIAYIVIAFLVLIAFNSNVYHNIRSIYLRTIRYLFNIPPPKITRPEALVLAKNILTFGRPARDYNLGIVNFGVFVPFAALEELHTWRLERRDAVHRTWVVIDNQDGTIIKRSWDWYLNQKDVATVVVHPISSAQKPQVSDAISEENPESDHIDTKQPIDAPIEK